MIGALPSPLRWKGWIAFPHTNVTIPCVHDLYAKQKVVTLVHAEELAEASEYRAWLLSHAIPSELKSDR